MSSTYWIKLHIATLDDPVLSALPDNLWRRYIELYLLSGEYQGTLPEPGVIAWKLRQNETKLEAELAELAANGLIKKVNGAWIVTRFEQEQLVDYGWSPLKKYVFERDVTCVYCGKMPEHLDHIIPRVKGGQDERTNTVAACAKCNQSKNDKDMLAWYRAQRFFDEGRLNYICLIMSGLH